MKGTAQAQVKAEECHPTRDSQNRTGKGQRDTCNKETHQKKRESGILRAAPKSGMSRMWSGQDEGVVGAL